MTTTAAPTLLTLFPRRREELIEELGKGAIATSTWAAGLPKGLQASLADALACRYAEVMAIPLEQVLLSGLKKAEAVIASARESRSKPDQSILLPMHDQTLLSRHQPKICVSLSGPPMLEVMFTVELKLHLKALVVTLRAGRMTAVRIGEAIGSGSVRLGELTLSRLQLTPIPLPGFLDLGAGLELLSG